jgi:hypothetical protein
MDFDTFFARVRKSLFNGKMTKLQVDGCMRLITAWDKYGTGYDTGCAYALAVSYHETGRRMQPVRETNATTTAQAIARLDKAFKAGKMKWVKTPYWQHGFFGRGDVQLTHEDNYAGPLRDAVLKEFQVDIHQDPDAVLRPDVSAFILIEGMTKGVTLKSDFTKYALEDFIGESKTDYDNARKTVNPAEKDTYKKIGDYARKFEDAIRAAREAAGEPFRGQDSKAGLYDGAAHAEVRQVQLRLRDLGYPEVGDCDGRWGTKTAAAILAFRNDNSLPTLARIDNDLLVALMKAQKREVAPERALATVADLTHLPEVKEGVTLKELGKWVGIGGAVVGVGNGGVEFQQLAERVEQFQALGRSVEAALPYLMVAAFGLGVFFLSRRILARTVLNYREGKRV